MPRIATFLICVSVTLLVAIGMVMLASTSYWANGIEQPHLLVNKQSKVLVYAILGSIVMIGCKPEWLRKFAPWLFLVGCGLLICCYLPYVGHKVNGASRWVKFPLLPQFQASEIGKLTTLIGVAAWYANNVAELRSFWRGFIIPGVILGIPMLLILFEKDMDTAMALGAIGCVIFACIGVKMRYIVPVLTIAAVLGYVMVMQDPTRRERVDAWQHLEENPPEYQDTNRQQFRSFLAFGSGGVEGRGLGNGIEKHGYLPEAHTDFIFPVIGEELGLFYTLGIVLCYLAFATGGFIIAMTAPDMFTRTLSLGLTLLVLVPAVINIAVTVGLLPNAGLPLPFISYGGTNLMFSLWSVALLLSMHRYNQREAMHESDEFIPKAEPMKL